MADIEKTVEIIFSGTDKSADIFKGVSKNLDTLSGKVANMTAPLAGVASKFEITGAAIGTALGIAAGAAISATSDFDEAFSEIVTLIDAPTESMQDFKDAVLDYARESTQPLEEITGALYSAISAGIPYSEAIDVIRAAEELTVAGRGSFAETTKTIVGLLNAYGEESGTAAKYADELFKTVAIGQTTLSDMAGKLGPLIGIAASAEVPFNELAGAIATLTKNGMPTPQAIDAIKSAISNIIKPSSQATKEAKDLGLAFDAEALATKGLPRFLADVSKATQDNVEPTARLFGDVQGLSGALILSKDGAVKYKEAMKDINDSNGIVVKGFNIMADEINNIHQKLANNVEVKLIEIGSRIIDNYRDIIKSVSDLFANMDFSGEAFDPLFDILNDVGEDISTFLSDMAKHFPEALSNIDWSPIERSFANLKDMVNGALNAIFGEGVDLSTTEGLTRALQTIVDAFGGVGNVIAGIGKSWTPFIGTFVDGLRKAAGTNEGTQEFVGNLLGLGQALNFISGIGSGAAGVIGGVASVISTLVNLKLASLVTNIGTLSSGLSSLARIGAITIPIAVSILGGRALSEIIYEAFPGLEEADKDAFRITTKVVIEAYDLLIGNAVDEVGELGRKFGGWIGDKLRNTFIDKFEEIDLENDIDPSAITIDPKIDWSQVDGAIDDFDLEEMIDPTTLVIAPTLDTTEVENAADAIDLEEMIDPTALVVSSEISFLYRWRDAGGTEHITETPPNPGEAIGEVEEIKQPIRVKPDDKSIEDTKKKIKQSFSSAKMGPVGLDFEIGPNAMQGLTNDIQTHFKDNPLSMEEVFDPSGLSDLFKELDTKDYRKRAMVEDAIRKQLSIQRDLANLQKAAAQRMQDAAYLMKSTSEQEGVIKIDAEGLEPEMEAFMWKLLKKIQVRANESGAEFLLAAAG